MSKRYLILLFVFLIVFTLTGTSYSSESLQHTAIETDFRITINDIPKELPSPIVTINNKSYLPIRQLGELLNLNINWDAPRKMIEISTNSPLIVNSINEELINNKESTSGKLISSREYEYISPYVEDFSFEKLVQESYLYIDDKTYEKYGPVLSPNIAAELGESLFGLEKVPISEARIIVLYDIESESWIVFDDYYGVINPGGINAFMIKSVDGEIITYRSYLK